MVVIRMQLMVMFIHTENYILLVNFALGRARLDQMKVPATFRLHCLHYGQGENPDYLIGSGFSLRVQF